MSFPELLLQCRASSLLPLATMPKVTINENRQALQGQNYIGFPWQLP
jgi:hypothetical protein